MVAKCVGTNHPTRLERTLKLAMDYIKRKGWVVKEADKNLGLVLMDKKSYRSLLKIEIGVEDFQAVNKFPANEILGRLKSNLKTMQHLYR